MRIIEVIYQQQSFNKYKIQHSSSNSMKPRPYYIQLARDQLDPSVEWQPPEPLPQSIGNLMPIYKAIPVWMEIFFPHGLPESFKMSDCIEMLNNRRKEIFQRFKEGGYAKLPESKMLENPPPPMDYSWWGSERQA
jgi:hypothetical protein